MKKLKYLLCVIIIFTIGCFSIGCSNNYGKDFAKLEELKSFLTQQNIDLSFPSTLPYQDYKDIKYNYIANFDNDLQVYNGYKLYCFTNPFNIGVYGYNTTSNQPLSDDPAKLTRKDDLTIDGKIVNLYQGIGHQDSIFLLATASINNMHYEIRIVGNKTTKKGDFINYIYEDNALYPQAINDIINIFKSLV